VEAKVSDRHHISNVPARNTRKQGETFVVAATCVGWLQDAWNRVEIPKSGRGIGFNDVIRGGKWKWASKVSVVFQLSENDEANVVVKIDNRFSGILESAEDF